MPCARAVGSFATGKGAGEASGNSAGAYERADSVCDICSRNTAADGASAVIGFGNCSTAPGESFPLISAWSLSPQTTRLTVRPVNTTTLPSPSPTQSLSLHHSHRSTPKLTPSGAPSSRHTLNSCPSGVYSATAAPALAASQTASQRPAGLHRRPCASASATSKLAATARAPGGPRITTMSRPAGRVRTAVWPERGRTAHAPPAPARRSRVLGSRTSTPRPVRRSQSVARGARSGMASTSCAERRDACARREVGAKGFAIEAW